MYESIYLFIDIFISVFSFSGFRLLSLGLSCFVVIHETYSLVKVRRRRVVSVVWAIYRVRVQRESQKFVLIN